MAESVSEITRESFTKEGISNGDLVYVVMRLENRDSIIPHTRKLGSKLMMGMYVGEGEKSDHFKLCQSFDLRDNTARPMENGSIQYKNVLYFQRLKSVEELATAIDHIR